MQNWKMYIAIIAIGVIVAYVALAPKSPVEVNTCQVIRGEIAEYIEEEGKTRLEREKKVFPSMAGFLGPIKFAIGDKVGAGEIIAVIEDIEISNEIDAAQAEIRALQNQIVGVEQSKPKKDQYAKAKLLIQKAHHDLKIAHQDLLLLETQLAQTNRDYRRISQLFANTIATEQEMEAITTQRQLQMQSLQKQKQLLASIHNNIAISQTDLEILRDAEDDSDYLRQVYKAQIDAQRARIAILQNNLQKTALIAPFDGVVLERITKGNVYLSFVSPDYYIVKIGDLDSMEIRVDILSDDIHKVKVKQRVKIFGPALDNKEIEGQVATIYPSAFTKISSLGIEQQRVTVIVHFDNSRIGLNPGYRVDVRILTQVRSNALIVPSRAVFTVNEQKYVFIVADDVAQLRPVQIGIETDDYIEIVDGVSVDDIVVEDAPNELQNKQAVISKKPKHN